MQYLVYQHQHQHQHQHLTSFKIFSQHFSSVTIGELGKIFPTDICGNNGNITNGCKIHKIPKISQPFPLTVTWYQYNNCKYRNVDQHIQPQTPPDIDKIIIILEKKVPTLLMKYRLFISFWVNWTGGCRHTTLPPSHTP